MTVSWPMNNTGTKTVSSHYLGVASALARRTDAEVRACASTDAIKTVLGRRHAHYSRSHELPAVQPPAQIPAMGQSGIGHHLARPKKHQSVQQSSFLPS